MGFLKRSGLGSLQELINGGRNALNTIRRTGSTLDKPKDEEEPEGYEDDVEDEDTDDVEEDTQVTHQEYESKINKDLPSPFAHPETRPKRKGKEIYDSDDPWNLSPNRPSYNSDKTLRPGKLPQHSASAKPNPTAPQFSSGGALTVRQRIVSEWAKIAHPITGFEYFCENYVYINNQKHGYMKFSLYGYQKRLVSYIRDNRFVITKKFRQAGASLLTGVYCLWYSLTHPRMQCMIVSIGLRESSKYLQENVREIYEALPQWMKGGLRNNPCVIKDEKEVDVDISLVDPIPYKRKKAPKDMATEMAFPNRSKIRSVPTGKAGGRGFTTKLLVIDEAAFIEKIDTFYTGAYPTINNAKGSVFVISTVNGTSGIGGWYYGIYKGALDGTNKYKVAEMSYEEHPDYNDPEWIEDTKTQLGERGWRQEVLGEFLASGNTYIDSDFISEMESHCIPPKRKEMGGKLWIWEDYIPGHHYSIGADCATKGGFDNSTAEVIDLDTGAQVAEYKGKLAEGEFAKVLAELGYRYGTCQVAPEMNAKAGGAVTASLSGVQRYKRIFRQANGDPGWNTTARSRNLMIADLETNIYGGNYPIRSTRLIDELKTFIVTKRGKIEHDANAHDDLLFAWMIATTPEVMRAAKKIRHKGVAGVMVDSDNDDQDGYFVGTVKPVYTSEQQKEEMRKQRQARLGDTQTGQAYLDIKEEVIRQGCPEDTIEWLLS